jgi:predicted DNA-binding transcriptional regulator YafY
MMNQHKMYRCIRMMEFLQEKPRNMHTIARYLNVNNRTVYRYIKLYESLGYTIIKDKFDKIKILKTYEGRCTN